VSTGLLVLWLLPSAIANCKGALVMAKKALPAARHEPKDVGGTLITGGTGLVLGSVVILALLVLWLFPNAMTSRTLHLPLSQYPNPQLQTNPSEDLVAFHGEEMRWLNSAGWIDKAHGIAHIPIADAMREVAKEGIPNWPTAPEQQR
jgi:hypothetical protein